MPRYIDADVLVKDIFAAFDGNWQVPCSSKDRIIQRCVCKVRDIIQRYPTADVVPASEVAKEFTCFVGDPHKVEHCPYLEEIENAKAEVAMEIFEEIEKAIADLEYRANTPRKTVKVEELKDQVNWVLHEVVPKTIAELKKKYTEGAE